MNANEANDERAAEVAARARGWWQCGANRFRRPGRMDIVASNWRGCCEQIGVGPDHPERRAA
jgi:hypothetical protein